MAYTQKSWTNGEVITAAALNNIEEGIVELKQATTGFGNNLDTQQLNVDGNLIVTEKTTTKDLEVTTSTKLTGIVTVPTPNNDSANGAATSKEYVDAKEAAIKEYADGNFASKSITISAGTGLTGGGTLETDRTLQLNIASDNTLGGIKVGSNLSINPTTGVLDATNTTYNVATATTAGLMSTNDFTKLSGIAENATANIGTVTGVQINGTTKNPTDGIVDIGNNIVTSITMNNTPVSITNGAVALGSVITDVSNKADKENPQFTGTATFGNVAINANNSTLSIGNYSLNAEILKNLCDFLPGDSVTNGHTYTLQLIKNNDTLQFTWVQVPENGGE